jgi:phosphoglycerate dehydrogenase-like enzyme
VAVDVWIPGDTAAEHRGLVPRGAEIHDLPMTGELPGRLGHADILVTDFRWHRAIEAVPRLEGLRVLQSLSAGVDAIAGRLPPHVTLCDAAGVHDIPVAEWVVAAILASRHRLPEYVTAQASGRWQNDGVDLTGGGADLEGTTTLIVGHGSIGRAVEERLRPFGVEFLRVARGARDGVSTVRELPALLPRADIVVILVPLTGETRGLVDAAFLAAMRRGALLVNAARGAVVDTGALIRALRTGRIAAALDVTDPEPLPPGHPLWSCPGLLITPHVAGAVTGLPERAWRLVADQVGRYLRGQPLLNVVVDGY